MPELTRVFESTAGVKARVLHLARLAPGKKNRRAGAPRRGSAALGGARLGWSSGAAGRCWEEGGAIAQVRQARGSQEGRGGRGREGAGSRRPSGQKAGSPCSDL